MPFKLTIDHTNTAHSSDHSDHSSSSSSVTDDEDSTGTGVRVRSGPAVEGHDYSDPAEEQDGSWNVVYPDEIGPSDSASRPRTSNQQRPFVEAPRLEEARRPSFRRHISREPARQLPQPRAHRSPPSEPPESVDSHEEWQGYARGPPQHYSRPYVHYAPGYPPHAYQTYPSPSAIPGGQQQMVPYGFSPYQPPTGGPAPSYFTHGHHGGPSHEIIPHAPSAGYFPYAPQGYQMPIPMSMSPPVVYPAYGGMYAHSPASPAPPAPPAPPVTTPPPPPSTSDTSKDDEKFARLEKLFLDQKAEQREREDLVEKAAQAKAAKAEADAKRAEEIATASAAAAAAAREEVEKDYQAAAKDKAAKAEAEAKKAEEIAAASAAAAAAAKEEVKKEHEAAAKDKAAKAEAEAKRAEEIATASAAAAAAAKEEVEKTAAAKPAPTTKEKDKPIKFKDAIGRRFNFPFDVCNTWSGMEYLIKEAFLHVADLGPHVAEGSYDLLGPKDEIIMPSIWESVIEPGWEITMHMWPIPEPPPEGGDALAVNMENVVIVEPGVPPPPPGGRINAEKKGKKKKEKIPQFMIWTAGKSKKGRVTAKSKKK